MLAEINGSNAFAQNMMMNNEIDNFDDNIKSFNYDNYHYNKQNIKIYRMTLPPFKECVKFRVGSGDP